jgi:hypothetical protein
MDGLNFRAPSGILEKYFSIDKYGLYSPRPEKLQMDKVKNRVERALNARTDLAFRLQERYYLTDVETTNNPYGNTNAIGAGIKMFGKRPLKGVKFRGKMELLSGASTAVEKQLIAREKRIEKYRDEVLANHKAHEPADVNSREHVLWQIDHDQALTGGGFDGNKVGDVTLTAMKGMIKSAALPNIADSTVSEQFMASILEVRDYLSEYIPLGSLKPDGLSKVRFEQDNDGMLGFPVMKKGGAPLDGEIATRLLIDTGIDTRRFVGSMVRDSNSQKDYPYRIQDALGYILDNLTPSLTDRSSIVTYLARIQKHGWKEEDGKIVPKPGKARTIFPNSAVEACIEGMCINPFNRALKEAKVPCFPSVQTKPVRVEMIKGWMKKHSSMEYGFLAADWSQYDATVPGWGLASIIVHIVKPFFNAKWHNWVDYVAYLLTFKYFLQEDNLSRINGEEYLECLNKIPNVRVGDYTIFGLINYLISGAKFTHIGGSLYGITAVHLTIPKLLGYKGVIGPQAGDDTLMGVPLSSIDLSSRERTYEPIAKAAKELGLDLNPSKQIFYTYDGELVGIFLQDAYCEKGELWGVGSAYRPLSALFMSERDKGLSVSEQIMAEISRMSQAYDSPFAEFAVEFWLTKEQYLLVLVKERGASEAFQFLVETAGGDIDDIIKRIEVGSFTYSIDPEDVRMGTIPILSVMDRVASNMSPQVGIAKALKSLNAEAEKSTDDKGDSLSTLDEEDILDD